MNAAGREQWSGRMGFILATLGSAAGLGSIWKFPYEVGTNGGSAFVLFYLLGLAFVVVPLMLAEFAIGRRGRSDARASILAVAREEGASPRWAWIGLLGVGLAFLILSYYAVIGGWALAYALETGLRGLPGAAAETAQARFDALLASPPRIIAYHLAFMLMTVAIVARGVAGGIERACMVLMPALLVLMLVLAAYAILGGGLAATLRFMFAFDPATITARAALEALGLGFFSIGVGMAVMVTYAAYAGPEMDLRSVAVATVVGDTAISFLAGFAIFPVVFANGLDPAGGPGLMFVTLPLAFAAMPFGTLAAAAFFLLLVVAALASAISLLEMQVALTRHVLGWTRAQAAWRCGAACWLAGLATVFSFNLWAGVFPLGFLPAFATATIFDLLDHLASNLLLPLGGLALAIFTGWALPARLLGEELQLGPAAAALLRLLLRYAVPAGIAAATVAPALW
jgi:NSS family neurotransmitter:Na+ symporter